VIQNKAFRIPFKGLKPGIHKFDFEVSASFFQEIEGSEILDAEISAGVTLDKKSNFMELQFFLEGVATVVCDRCLDPVSLPVEYEGKIIVKFGEETTELDESLLVLSQAEDVLDVSQYLFEFAHLSLPMKRIHPQNAQGVSGCNPLMLEKLKEYLVEEDLSEEDDVNDDI